jgi:hypothetical protein
MIDFSTILFIVLAVSIGVLIIWLKLPSTKGLIGELFVKNQLKQLAQHYKGLSFHNLMFSEGEKSTQLDNLLITNKGVYVIEVKNYSGRIYGDQNQDQWYQTIRYDNKRKGKRGKTYTKTHIAKNSFFNPIKQNLIHVNAIKSYIESLKGLPLFNIVVFTNQSDLSNLEMKDESAYVINRRNLNKLVEQIEKKNSLAKIDLLKVEEEIVTKNSYSPSNLRKHITKIKQKYRK